MACELEETGIPSPAEVGAVLRELAPELCKRFDSLTAFQEYVWGDKNLREIRVHPRQEMLARLWCDPPPRLMWRNTIRAPSFTLHIDHSMPEYEMRLTYKDGKSETIKLD